MRAILWIAVSSEAQAADEKESLPSQERDLLAVAAREGWDVVDILRVPGFSRNFYNFTEFAAAARKEGITAGDQMIEHWERQDFDVFACRDGSRFGRDQGIFGEVVRRIIDGGALLFSLSDGWIDERNHRMYISMASYAASTQVDNLKRNQKASKDGLAARGLPGNGSHVWSHRVVRNEYGRALSFVVDETKRLIFEDGARLFIEGIGWRGLETELFTRYGHGHNGQPFKRYFFYHMFHNPAFWGHTARNHKNINLPNGQKVDLWVFDETIPPPEGVSIWHHTHPPALTGDLAERVRAEMRRRRHVIRGTMRPHRSHKFSGLLVCAYCGYNLVYASAKTYIAYCCHSKFVARSRPGCPKKRYVSETVIQDWFTARLEAMLDQRLPDLLVRPVDSDDQNKRIQGIRAALINLREQARTLIDKQIAAPASLSEIYTEKINDLGRRVDMLERELAAIDRAIAPYDARALEQAFMQLQSYEVLEGFWQQPETVVNQLLHALMGNNRLLVKDKVVIGLTLKT